MGSGSIIIKRDPVTVGAVVSALIVILGSQLDWSDVLIAALVGVVTACVGIVQALNVFGTDKFTSLALNLVAAVFVLAAAMAWNIDADLQNAITAAIPILLGLFARNGVDNRFAADGTLKVASGPVEAPVAGGYTAYSSDPKHAATYYPGEGQGPGGGG